MTLGQRIQELRKQRGMSQESLGDALGVSRQAVSKWEGDNGIPELDTLIAISRLFEVTVGQLLGIEPSSEQKSEPATSVNQETLESVLSRYATQTPQKEERSWFVRWGWVVSSAIVLTTVFIVMFAQLFSLRSTVKLLRHDLASLQVTVSNNQNNLSGQIRSTLYDVLAEEANLLSTFGWEIMDFDLENQTVTLCLNATMKEYAAGSKLQFCAAWSKTDGTEGQTYGDWTEGPNFQSEITIPLNHRTAISIRVEDVEGNIKEQILQNPIHELHPDNFHLFAYNLSSPFAITVNNMSPAKPTVRAEWARIKIMSIFPDFIWPKKAVLTAYINGSEIMNESLTVTPSEQEAQVFTAFIQDFYYDLTMREGDVLDVVLTVTDNLGRTEQFTDRTTVERGQLERQESAAPVIAID